MKTLVAAAESPRRPAADGSASTVASGSPVYLGSLPESLWQLICAPQVREAISRAVISGGV